MDNIHTQAELDMKKDVVDVADCHINHFPFPQLARSSNWT